MALAISVAACSMPILKLCGAFMADASNNRLMVMPPRLIGTEVKPDSEACAEIAAGIEPTGAFDAIAAGRIPPGAVAATLAGWELGMKLALT